MSRFDAKLSEDIKLGAQPYLKLGAIYKQSLGFKPATSYSAFIQNIDRITGLQQQRLQTQTQLQTSAFSLKYLQVQTPKETLQHSYKSLIGSLPFLWFPPKLHGRGRKPSGMELWDKYYREREKKMPTIAQLLGIKIGGR